MFKLEFETDNAAFGENAGDMAHEVVRILLAVSERVWDHRLIEGNIHDANGNKVGSWSLD